MSVTAASGFRAAGVAAGVKASGGLDVALVVNDGPLDAAAAVFTSNRAKANPVLWSQQAIAGGTARAVILNAGGANCFTGAFGFQTTHQTAERVAERLGTAMPGLPTWAAPPVMMPPLSATSRVMKIGITSKDRSLMDLSMLAYWTIRARLLGVPNVANVAIWGERLKMLQVQVDPEQLVAGPVTVA